MPIPRTLPPGLESYGRSPDFTHDALPAKLRSAHSTKAGTWGLLHVLEGRLRFQLESGDRDDCAIGAGETLVIEPQVPHHVEFLEPGRFFVEFFRAAAPRQGG